MSFIKTYLLIRSSLLTRGLIHYIHSINSVIEIEIIKSFTNLRTDKEIRSLVFIIEPDLLTDPPAFTLERIKRIYPDAITLAISEKKISDNLIPYFDDILLFTADENEIISKLEDIFNSDKSKINKRNTNGPISEREIEILKYVALGYTNKEISDKLFISAHTVIAHRKNITAKLGIKTIAGLAVYAVLNRIIDTSELKN